MSKPINQTSVRFGSVAKVGLGLLGQLKLIKSVSILDWTQKSIQSEPCPGLLEMTALIQPFFLYYIMYVV